LLYYFNNSKQRFSKGADTIFTIPERRLLNAGYFTIIRSDETFYEIKSKNTGHYWIVKKQNSSPSVPIQVYHKHSLQIPYYHKQRSTNTVQRAIEIIKEHDAFAMSHKLTEVIY
jgi:hypothetical protein